MRGWESVYKATAFPVVPPLSVVTERPHPLLVLVLIFMEYHRAEPRSSQSS